MGKRAFVVPPLDGYARYHLRSDVRRSTPDRGAFAATGVSYSAAFFFCVVALSRRSFAETEC
jgi:hypothetical protein